MVGIEDVLAEPVDMPADAIVVLAKTQDGLAVLAFKSQVVMVLGQMQIFANLFIPLPHLGFLFPAPGILPDLAPDFVQRGLELLQLGFEGIPLLGCRERVVRHDDGAFPAPVFAGRAPGRKKVVLAALSLEFPVCTVSTTENWSRPA